MSVNNHLSTNKPSHTVGIADAPHVGYRLAALVEHLHALVDRNEPAAVGLCIDGAKVEAL